MSYKEFHFLDHSYYTIWVWSWWAQGHRRFVTLCLPTHFSVLCLNVTHSLTLCSLSIPQHREVKWIIAYTLPSPCCCLEWKLDLAYAEQSRQPLSCQKTRLASVSCYFAHVTLILPISLFVLQVFQRAKPLKPHHCLVCIVSVDKWMAIETANALCTGCSAVNESNPTVQTKSTTVKQIKQLELEPNCPEMVV